MAAASRIVDLRSDHPTFYHREEHYEEYAPLHPVPFVFETTILASVLDKCPTRSFYF